MVPISTSASQTKRGFTVVEIPGGCHQVTTLDRAKLTKRTGALPPALLGEVELGLKAAMDLD